MTPRQRMTGLLAVLGATVAAIAAGGDGEAGQADAGATAARPPVAARAPVSNPASDATSNPDANPGAARGTVPRPAPASPRAMQAGADDPVIDLERLTRRREPGDAVDIFAARSWQPPPPPPPRAVEPPKPVAPPLPFVFMGRMIEDDKPVIFLRRGEEPVVARERDVIEKDYRVDGIGPSSMVLTYLPLGQQQVLSFGSRIDASQ
jgi:hypothetical protein